MCENLQIKFCGPRPWTTLCASLRSGNAFGRFTRGILCGILREKCPGPERGTTLCASLRGRNAIGRFTKATFYRNLQVKCRGPAGDQDPDTHFVRACAVEMHFNISQNLFHAEIYRKNAQAQACSAHFARACAIETHMEMSQEQSYAEIYRENSAPQSEHLNQAPALTPTVRTPQCGHTVWGKMQKERLNHMYPHRRLSRNFVHDRLFRGRPSC